MLAILATVPTASLLLFILSIVLIALFHHLEYGTELPVTFNDLAHENDGLNDPGKLKNIYDGNIALLVFTLLILISVSFVFIKDPIVFTIVSCVLSIALLACSAVVLSSALETNKKYKNADTAFGVIDIRSTTLKILLGIAYGVGGLGLLLSLCLLIPSAVYILSRAIKQLS